jgi:acetyltransferase-like isoleucine patch superfamily enzyme
VLGLGSVATRDLEPWGVYAGVPAVKVKERKRPLLVISVQPEADGGELIR